MLYDAPIGTSQRGSSTTATEQKIMACETKKQLPEKKATQPQDSKSSNRIWDKDTGETVGQMRARLAAQAAKNAEK